jgi:hypothetical protein
MRKTLLFGAAFLLSLCGPTLGTIVYSGSQNVVSPMSPMWTINVAGSQGDWDDFTVELWVPMGSMDTRLEIFSGMMVPGAMVMGMSGIFGLGGLAENWALGAMIGPTSSLDVLGSALLTGSGNFHEDGGYIGLVLGNPSGGTQYGWIHMAGESDIGDPIQWRAVFNGLAYETEPGEAIAAGDTGVIPLPGAIALGLLGVGVLGAVRAGRRRVA